MSDKDWLQLMHDTMSPTRRIKSLVAQLKKGGQTPEEKDKILSFIDKSVDDLNEALDYFYIKQNPKT